MLSTACVLFTAADASCLTPASYRDRIRDEFSIEVLDANRLTESSQLQRLYEVLASLPPNSLPPPECERDRKCLNAIRVRDLLVGTSAGGFSPYLLSSVDLVDQWWQTIMRPQGWDGPNIFSDYSTTRDYMHPDGIVTVSKYFIAVAYHELMHQIESLLHQDSPRYRKWREDVLELLEEDRRAYIRCDVLERHGGDYFAENANELLPGLMNAWQQDSWAMLEYCAAHQAESWGPALVAQCLGILDALSTQGYGVGQTSRGLASDAEGNIDTFDVAISRDTVTSAVDGFVSGGRWYRWQLDDDALPVVPLDLRCGDTDGNGYGRSDYYYVARAAKGLATCSLEVCDVNRDGAITRKDAALVRRAIKKPAALPCLRGA